MTSTPTADSNWTVSLIGEVVRYFVVRPDNFYYVLFHYIVQFYWMVQQDAIRTPSESRVLIHKYWYGLPANLSRIDAVYEHPLTGNVRFFIGNRYYEFKGNQIHKNTPKHGRPITDYRLPHTIEKVDAVFVWGYNQKTYIVCGRSYWKYDEQTGELGAGYPRDIALWEGVPFPLDAAFRFVDDQTYFFQGENYWKFNDRHMRVFDRYPRSINRDWLGCEPVTTVTPEQWTSDGRKSSAFIQLIIVAQLFVSFL